MQDNNTHRHKDNPLEKHYHDSFKKHFELQGNRNCSTRLESIVSYQSEGSKIMTERETKLVLNFCQWLGSPDGQSFMKENLTEDAG